MHDHYQHLLQDIKARIRGAQLRAALSSNRELILLYWDVGRMLDMRQVAQGWGAAVVPRLAKDLHNDFPEIKGFSERNLNRMIAFFREYPAMDSILPQAVAKLAKAPVAAILSQLTVDIPWGHNLVLMEKVQDSSARLWYVQQTIAHGWSRSVLSLMIERRSCRHRQRHRSHPPLASKRRCAKPYDVIRGFQPARRQVSGTKRR
jgi:predicted nuclease of restriction endonuclease-like (RecB) superfamily